MGFLTKTIRARVTPEFFKEVEDWGERNGLFEEGECVRTLLRKGMGITVKQELELTDRLIDIKNSQTKGFDELKTLLSK